MPAPNEVSLFLKQHVGTAVEVAEEKVPFKLYSPEFFLKDNISTMATDNAYAIKKGKVTEGEMIGTVGTKLGANLHASISGTVEGVVDVIHPEFGKSSAIVIAGDGSTGEGPAYNIEKDWHHLTREDLLAKIHAAGIVGLGGAGFPADFKLNVKPDVQLDTLILNGSECEPYVTCDHRVMVEYAKEVVEGAKIILTILGIKKCVIGVEANKPDAIEQLNRAIDASTASDGLSISVQALEVKYPHGAADQIMQSITGRVRPSGKRSSTIGIIVQNVSSTKAIYDAVVYDKPFYERVITISGGGIARPANLLVKIGTSMADIVAYLGGTTSKLAKVVMGGPMMGAAVSSLHFPVTKTTSGVLFLTEDEVEDDRAYGRCIRCGFCLDACPMGLEPNNVGLFVEAGKALDCGKFGIEDDCFECGSCTYVCPAKRPLVQFIRLAKIKLWEARKKAANS